MCFFDKYHHFYVESKEVLHLCVSARTKELLALACKYTEELLLQIYEDYIGFCIQTRNIKPAILAIKRIYVRTSES